MSELSRHHHELRDAFMKAAAGAIAVGTIALSTLTAVGLNYVFPAAAAVTTVGALGAAFGIAVAAGSVCYAGVLAVEKVVHRLGCGNCTLKDARL